MQEETSEQALRERLTLIETMIAEGRGGTESWGWAFLLWGVAFYVATAWATLGRSNLAWPVTMIVAAALTATIASRSKRGRPGTTLGRALASLWIAAGISMFVLLFSLGISGRYEFHAFVAIVGAMLGFANGTSGLFLKWKMQFACAIVWWASAVAACFASAGQAAILFLAATFFCQIVFGVYAMICDSRRRSRQGASHA